METLLLELEPDTLRRIEEAARRAGLLPEQIVREAVETAFPALTPESNIEAIGAYVTAKNSDLYRRLA